MKPSYYNLSAPDETGGAVVFNTRSGCMAQLDREHWEALRAFEERGEVPADGEFRDGLLACGFAVEDRGNELEAIRLGLLRSRFATETLSLTIAPTQDCNFRCVYCYEKDQLRHQVMDRETREKLLDYVTGLADHIRRLHICWYGGEPLLAQDTIRELSEAFLRLCGEHHVDYSASIITNGSLLDEKTIDLLNQCRVTQAQVTLDGSRASHDSRRPLAGGGSSFDAILRSLKLCRDHYRGAVALRMNVDKNNLSEIGEVKALLKQEELDRAVFLYLGHVTDENGTCAEGSCLGGCEFARRNLEFLLDQEDGGGAVPERGPPSHHQLLRRRLRDGLGHRTRRQALPLSPGHGYSRVGGGGHPHPGRPHRPGALRRLPPLRPHPGPGMCPVQVPPPLHGGRLPPGPAQRPPEL